MIKSVRKRDGRIVDFEKENITNAIFRAAKAVGGEDYELAKVLTVQVVQKLEKKFPKEIPSVEDVQDMVEKVLIENGHAKTAKAYILYRKERERVREAKEILGVRDELKLPVNTIKVLKARYLLKDEEGNVTESTGELFRRVARHLTLVDLLYHEKVFDKNKDQTVKQLPELEGVPKKAKDMMLNINNVRMLHKAYQRLNLRKQMKVTFNELLEILKNKWDEIKARENEFYDVMTKFEFMPNSPTLMNAGVHLGQLSACFTPDQPVLSNPGLKPINEINVGDKVVTHLGNLENVTHKFVREIDDYIFRIKVKGMFHSTMSVTAEHPIFAIKKYEVCCARNKHRVCNGFPKSCCFKKPLDYRDDCSYLIQPMSEPRWISSENLEEGDYVVVSTNKEVVDKTRIRITDILPEKEFILEGDSLKAKGRPNEGKLIPNSINIDKDFMRLVGYWLADGSISKRYDKADVTGFTSNIKEKEYYEDILRIMRKKFNITTKVEFNKQQNTAQLRFHSTIVAQLFHTLFGMGFDKKDLPAWVMSLPPEKQFHLIVGLFRGDGCHHNGKKQDVFFISLSNYNLATKIWNILMRFGYFFNINSYKPKAGTKRAYRISSAPSLCEDLVKAVGKNIFEHRKIFPQSIKLGDYILRPISKIEKVRFTGKVYNLEVENDNSYVANGVAVHNCFVLPVNDSLDSIFDTLKYTALIHQSGGGTGFSFSGLRPNGDMVKSTKGIASGPLSFMRVFDVATDVIKQGGKRRGANMGIMKIDHPDILDFVTSKDSENRILTNFNISVAATDKFMKALENNREYELVSPRTGKVFKKLFARQVWEMITYQAWKTGDPGMIFIDEINRHNQTPHIGDIEATNPCGEQTLLSYESCNLGSVNLSKMIKETKGRNEIDWKKLEKVVRLSVHLLDNVIDANFYPIKQIEFMTHANRKIGLGVMGFADMLIKLGIRYDSEEALKLGEKVMKFVTEAAREKSVELGKDKGSFPNFKGSVWDKKRYKHMRNATVTTIAPTGTISIISNCSSGIEPLFAVAFVRKNVLSGEDELVEVNNLFEKYAKEKGFYSEDLMYEVSRTGSLEGIEGVPKEAIDIFKTAHDVDYEWHIRMQAAFQKHTDNAVSKTINLRSEAGIKDVERAYELAYKLKCKGITIYRDMSKVVQVIYIGEEKRKKIKYVKNDKENKELKESEEVCPSCKSKLYFAEGCYTCLNCGYSKCA